MKIKKIITALLNDKVNQELQKDKEIDVLSKDFLYQEAVLEFIEENKEIDYLILNEELPGEKIEEFIKKIKNIKIIIFIEKIKNKEILLKNGAYRVFENGEIGIEEIKTIIKENNYTRELEKEIENLKRIIYEKNEEKNILKINKSKKEKKGKIISVIGTNTISKILFINSKNKYKKNKSLLISFDWLNKKQEKEVLNKKIEIAQINKIFFSKENNIEKIKKYINENIKKYEYIFINHSTESFFEINKNILENADKIYFIIENNIEEILLANNLLKIYTNIWKINKEKINIILNKIKINKITKKYKNIKIIKIPYKNQIKEQIWI